MDQTQQEVEELRVEVEQLTEAVRNLAYDLRYALNDEKHEREKIMLKVENQMLRFEQGLPPKDTNNPA